MSRPNRFVVTEIPGPNVMKKICERLNYSKDQMSQIDVIRPTSFPLYVYENPDTRYWYGSGIAMGAKEITWIDYLSDHFEQSDIALILESDVNWFSGRIKDLLGTVKRMVGD